MFLLSLLALSAAQSAAAPQAPLVVPPNRWVIDYSRMSCTLARHLGDETSPIVAFNAPFGWEPGEFVVMDGGSGLDPRLAGDLAMRIDDGTPLAVRARHEMRNGRNVARLTPMPEDFLGRMAGAHRLSLTKGNDSVLSFAMPEARAAIDGLTHCNDDLLQSWGIDVTARRALRQLPRIRNYSWAYDIMPSAETYLVFATEVSEQGAPLDCRILISSRNARMDRTVCGLVRSRARFDPAQDSQGRPVRAQYVTRVHWTMSEQ